ncbi:MAG TPA: MFS transporter [Pseudonocardiaceae bacterium]
MTTAPTRFAARLLPAPGAERALATAALTSSVGQGVLLSCGVVFVVRVVGLDARQVGAGLTAGAALALLLPVPVGWLVDRVGARRCSVLFAAGTAAGTAGYALTWSFPSYCVAVLLLGGSVVGLGITHNVLVGVLLTGGDRIRFKAYQRSVRNIGLSLGALVAVVPLQADSRPVYQAALGLVAAGIAASGYWTARLAADGRSGPRAHPLSALRDLPFAVTAVLCGLTAIRYSVLTVALPLWVVERMHAPRGLVSAILVLNTALVVLVQVRAARGAATTRQARGLNLRGSFALAGSCLLFGLAAAAPTELAVALLLTGVVVLTFGEMWTSAAAWTFAFGLTRDGRHGRYQAAFALGTALGSLGGPAVAVWLAAGTASTWTLGAAGFALVGAATAGALSWARWTGTGREDAG